METDENFIDTDEADYEDNPMAKAAFDSFGIKYLFPWQQMVIANIMEGVQNQIVLLPTGAGKSLCFLIPAVLLPGKTLVIYPLLALMTDQQRRMTDGSLGSVMFRGGQTKEEREENFRQLENGAKVIIANPEVLQDERLVSRLKKVGISHVAIDEAHCVSEWGDSFRPSYLTLGKILQNLEPPVITAFTATASPPVLSRISEILFGSAESAHIVRSESDRPNIHYFVRYAAAKKKEALYLSQTEERPMIIFCGTRSRTEEMSRELNASFGDGFSKFYHAGLEKSEKDEIEKWFFDSSDGVLCATCAYGMGVDKKNIHTVIHLDPPQTAEAYIQEAGRGGRDGSVAKGILLWSLEDSIKTSQFEDGTREAALRQFAQTKDCRRQVLLDALGAEQAFCSGCDLCNLREAEKYAEGLSYFKRKKFLAPYRQKPADYEIAYKMIRRRNHFYTEEILEDELFKKFNSQSEKDFGKNLWTHKDVAEIVQELEMSGMIKKDKFLWRNRFSAV